MADASVGERVRRLRKFLALTQLELGQLFELDKDDLGNVEFDRRSLNASRLRLLAALERAAAHHPPEVVYPWRRRSRLYEEVDVTPRLAHIYKLATTVSERDAA